MEVFYDCLKFKCKTGVFHRFHDRNCPDDRCHLCHRTAFHSACRRRTDLAAGGIGKLAGPTGGYLLGFLLLALIVGKASDMTDSWIKIALALVLGQIADMAIGTAWLMWMAHMDLKFLPGNAVKTIAVVLIGKTVKPLLGKVLDQ